MLARNNGGCWICGKVPNPDGPSLHVEHDHKIAKEKIAVKKVKDNGDVCWRATTKYFTVWDRDRTKARAVARRLLLRKSVRGLACWKCNSGIQKFRDNPKFLLAASGFLSRHQSGEKIIG
jgi:hypothetical protein